MGADWSELDLDSIACEVYDSTLSNYAAFSSGEVTCAMTFDQNNHIIRETVTVSAGYDWVRFSRYK